MAKKIGISTGKGYVKGVYDEYAESADYAATARKADSATNANFATKADTHKTKKITSEQSFRTLVTAGNYQSYAVVIDMENLTINGIAIPKGSIGYFNVSARAATLNLIDPRGNNITAFYNYSTVEWTVRDKPAEAGLIRTSFYNDTPPRYITEAGIYVIDIVPPEIKDGNIPVGTTVTLFIPNLDEDRKVHFEFEVSKMSVEYLEGWLFFNGGRVNEDGTKYGSLEVWSDALSEDGEIWIVNIACIAKFDS